MSFTLSMIEFILLIFGAIVVGIVVHLLIGGRKNRTGDTLYSQADDAWKLKYADEIGDRDREISELQRQLREAEEKNTVLSRESDLLRREISGLQSEVETLKKQAEEMDKTSGETIPPLTPVMGASGKGDYLDQLLFAQGRLMEQNEKISQLLGNMEVLREKEEKQRQIMRDNAELAAQINLMKGELNEKEKEINSMKQKEHLTRDMASMLDNAYTEFNTLQLTIQKLEAKLTASRLTSLEYEDIKEEYSRVIKEVEDYRSKAASLAIENQQLHQELSAIREKFREADFQRQQLQKRISHLGELNADLQLVADTNKKLENQLKQIGRLEDMLHTIAEEKGIHLRGDA